MKNNFEELVQSARSASLADYFLQSGYTTESHGAEIYIKEFPGLCVNKNTGAWYSHYEGIGGKNSVDCLVKVCGRDFKQAVYELTGREISENTLNSALQKAAPNDEPKKELQMP